MSLRRFKKERRISKFKELHIQAYMSWRGMRERCDDLNNKYYGGRGVKYCERWNSFENFLEDMGDPSKDALGKRMTLDRKDNNDHYHKDNCKWSTQLEQLSNRSDYKSTIVHL